MFVLSLGWKALWMWTLGFMLFFNLTILPVVAGMALYLGLFPVTEAPWLLILTYALTTGVVAFIAAYAIILRLRMEFPSYRWGWVYDQTAKQAGMIILYANPAGWLFLLAYVVLMLVRPPAR